MSDPHDLTEAENKVYDLTYALIELRDRLDPIVKGEIKKGRPTNRSYPGVEHKEYRKTTLKDARSIAHHMQVRINQLLKRDV